MNSFKLPRLMSSTSLFVATALVVTSSLGINPSVSFADEGSVVESLNAVQVVQQVEAALKTTGVDGVESADESLDYSLYESLSQDLAGSDVVVDVSYGLDSELSVTLPDSASVAYASDEFAVVDSTSEGLKRVVQQLPGDSVRLLTVADNTYSENANHEYEYSVSLEPGQWLHKFEDGNVGILSKQDSSLLLDATTSAEMLMSSLPEGAESDPGELLEEAHIYSDVPEGAVLTGLFAEPWAVDAAGKQLDTSLELIEGKLVQRVNTDGAVYPVVSDPLPLVGVALVGIARVLAPHAIRAFVSQSIRVGARATISGGYRTFQAFKNAHGTKRGFQWHHIVEQSTIRNRKFDPRWIHNKNNLIQVPKAVHQKCVNSWMAKKGVRKFGVYAGANQTMRQWVHSQSFSTQHRIGVALLRYCGVAI